MKKSIKYFKSQRGISLYVIMIVILLSSLLTLWASRTSLFNELVLSNDVDYQRAFEAAQAIMQDAEMDIRGVRSDGSPCVPNPLDVKVCRRVGAPIFYPLENQDLGKFFSDLSVAKNSSDVVTGCIQGICVKRTGNQDFWTDTATLNNMLLSAARYGEFTGAPIGTPSSKQSNAILNNRTDEQGAWYWVEVMNYLDSSNNTALITGSPQSQFLPLSLNDPNVVYRITALARGVKPGTQVVLQSTFTLQNFKN